MYGNLKVHLTFSFETVFELIGVWVVARVLARSWLWAGHAPALAAHSGGAWPTAAASLELDVLLPDFEELLPQPARATVTARATRAASASLPRLRVRILFAKDIVERLPSNSGTCRNGRRAAPPRLHRQPPFALPTAPNPDYLLSTRQQQPSMPLVSTYRLPPSTGNS